MKQHLSIGATETISREQSMKVSDVFGSLVKQYVSKQTADKADWLIGHGMFTDINKALRSMKAPGTARPNDPNLHI
jgi:Zn-dependent metalloprotease